MTSLRKYRSKLFSHEKNDTPYEPNRIAYRPHGCRQTPRRPLPHDLSWGDRDYCEGLFCEIFRRVDTSIVRYRHLPEYAGIIDWMASTEGRGLLLYGDCGRGKSIILTGVVPVLLAMQERMTVAIHADELSKPYELALRTAGYDPKMTNLDYLTRTAYPIIDELGVEPLVNDYGEKYEGFNRVINAAERYLRPLFLSTNLYTRTAARPLWRADFRPADTLVPSGKVRGREPALT